MSRLRNPHPLAPISPNIISTGPGQTSKSPRTISSAPVMENRITQHDESDTQIFDVLEDHSSDSSFERRMLREMKMEREVSLATRPRPFSKANKRPLRSRVTLDQFDRKPTHNALPPAEIYSTSSGEQQRDEVATVPRNVAHSPRAWGSRARRTPGFLDRFNRVTKDQTPVVEGSDPVDWADAAADVALPSTEDSPLSRKSSTRGTPSTIQREKNQSLDKVLSWDVDFSGQSMIASTPAAGNRNRRLQDIAQAEIDASREQFTFTPPPHERPLLAEIRQAEIDAAAEFPTPLYERSGSEIRAENTDPSEIKVSQGQKQQTTARQNENRSPEFSQPDNPRLDSRDLLRRLSRSVSGTPDGKAKPVAPSSEMPGPESTSSYAQRHGLARFEDSTVVDRDSLKDKSREQTRSEQSNITKRGPKSASSGHLLGKSTLTSAPKTPVVTGAWVETPGVVRSQFYADNSSKTGGVGNSKPHEFPEPQLPRSALSAVIGKAKASNIHNAEDDIGDATIQSLEDVMDLDDQDTEASIMGAGIPLPEGMHPTVEDRLAIREILEQRITANLPYLEAQPPTAEERVRVREMVENRLALGVRKGRPASSSRQSKLRQEFVGDGASGALTPRRRGRIEEDLQLQRMSEQVSTMHSRTRSLNAGLGRIERHISGASGCHHCGCPGDCYGAQPFSALGRSVKSAFYRKEDGKRRPTWFGWIIAFCLFWAVLEGIMCLIFCRPVYEDTMSGFGFYPDRPEPPFVLLKTAFGPIWSLSSAPANACLGFINWAWNLLWYVIEEDGVQASITSTASRVVSTATKTVISQTVSESDWSMEADEII